jgi:Transposase DDE domain
MLALFKERSGSREQHLPTTGRDLAAFAREVLILDESTLDQMKRWLPHLRGLPSGHDGLLPGRLAGLFDVRTQLWRRFAVLDDAKANCKVHAREMLSGLSQGVLFLFDAGYFAFEWFDELTAAGHWWISRRMSSVSFPIIHIFVQADGLLDALVWMGESRTNRAGEAVRLIQYRWKGQWYSHLTNVLDPLLLSAADVSRLSARRWDIELAFRLLKDHLHLNLLWSAKWNVIGTQVWACLTLAQLFHGLQMQLAQQADVQPFDGSMALLVRQVPRLLTHGLAPVPRLLQYGRAMGIIRASTRLLPDLPTFRASDLSWPPPDLCLHRAPASSHSHSGPHKHRSSSSPSPKAGTIDASPS